jgi:hypothetical protein
MKKLMLTLLLSISILSVTNAQQSEIYSTDGIAINGYDAVAYFTESKPVKGDNNISVQWKNARWLFANIENAALFKTNPEKYAPQYGGYCAYGCSGGYKAKTSPDAWTIDNGKLYLNYNTGVRTLWDKDRANYILKADSNWPRVKETKYH